MLLALLNKVTVQGLACQSLIEVFPLGDHVMLDVKDDGFSSFDNRTDDVYC